MSLLNQTVTRLVQALMIFYSLSFSAWASETGTETITRYIEYNALLEAQWAYGVSKNNYQKLQFIYEPEINIELPNNHKLTMIGRLRGDINDKLEPVVHRKLKYHRYPVAD